MKKNNNLDQEPCNSIYESRCHVINGMTHDFFYLEFSNEDMKEDYLQMMFALKEHRDKYYNYAYLSCKEVIEIYANMKPIVSSEQDIKHMFLTIDEILKYLKDAVALNLPHRGEKEWNPNRDVQGYYLDHQYRGDEFPKSIYEKIHSADSYVTLINDYGELLFSMKNGKNTSLFYTIDTQ